MYNILHQYALKNDLWYEFDLKNRGMEKLLFVPKNEFVIDGLKDEIGVKTFGAIYIRSDSDIYKYVRKMIDIFLKEDMEENRNLLEVFLGNIFDSRILEQTYSPEVDMNNIVRQMMEDRFIRLSDELLTKMWSKIDVEEFTKVILTQNYSLYSIANWSGKDESI